MFSHFVSAIRFYHQCKTSSRCCTPFLEEVLINVWFIPIPYMSFDLTCFMWQNQWVKAIMIVLIISLDPAVMVSSTALHMWWMDGFFFLFLLDYCFYVFKLLCWLSRGSRVSFEKTYLCVWFGSAMLWSVCVKSFLFSS